MYLILYIPEGKFVQVFEAYQYAPWDDPENVYAITEHQESIMIKEAIWYKCRGCYSAEYWIDAKFMLWYLIYKNRKVVGFDKSMLEIVQAPKVSPKIYDTRRKVER